MKTEGNILVVDDKPANLSVVTSMLTDRGFNVRPAISGKVALRALATKLPDVILLDINMPEMDGYEVCRRIKDSEDAAHIPVIFLSAADSLDDKVKAFQVGGVDYVTKPFQAEEVIARVTSQMTLARQRQEIEALASFKDELLRTVSHDLKNPLTNIIGYTEMLLEDVGKPADPERASDMLHRVKRSAKFMYDLVTTLLDLDRLEGGIILDIKPTSVLQVLADIHGQFQLAASSKKISLKLVHDEDTYMIPVDPARLAQALANLVSNAIKYTPEGGNVSIELERQDSQTSIRISDDGYGIPEDALPNLFEKFYRVDSSEHREQEGTGLGLSIVKVIIDLHDGKIKVESEEGKGSEFKILLPNKQESA